MRDGTKQQYDLTLMDFLNDLKVRAKKDVSHIKFAKVKCDKCGTRTPENELFLGRGQLCETCYARRNLSPADFKEYQERSE